MPIFEQDLSDALRPAAPTGEHEHTFAGWLDPKDLALPHWSHREANGTAHGILLGKRQGRYIGRQDDGHILSVVSSAGGVGESLLVPNLLTYDGSMLVVDPGGDLARQTAELRRSKGQSVVVLDPFGASGLATGRFNPLDLLVKDSATVVDDAAALAAAMITGASDDHWTISARLLIKGLLLLTLQLPVEEHTLITLGELLFGQDRALVQIARRGEFTPQQALARLLRSQGKTFDGALERLGIMFDTMPVREYSAIAATAMRQLAWLSSSHFRSILTTSDVDLNSLKSAPTTLYLCLPHTRFETHAPWLRLMLKLALDALADEPSTANIPMLVVLTECNALGRISALESTISLPPARGVRLWLALNSMAELQSQYPAAWQTMIANMELMTFWANNDASTFDFIGARLGTAALSLDQLLGRETRRCLVLAAGCAPVIVERLNRDDALLAGRAV